MKVLSMSLWGSDPMYCAGAMINIGLSKKWYPDYEVWIYCDRSVCLDTRSLLEENGARIILKIKQTEFVRLFWRFEPMYTPGVDRFISRDADSRIGEREAFAVREWEQSGKAFHIMRDHPNHLRPIMGGMWGCIGGSVPGAEAMISSAIASAEDRQRQTHQGIGFDEDQAWLESRVWPFAEKNNCTHDDLDRFGGAKRFSVPRTSNHDFVGNKYEAGGSAVYTTNE